jgi:hypothetical protein
LSIGKESEKFEKNFARYQQRKYRVFSIKTAKTYDPVFMQI